MQRLGQALGTNSTTRDASVRKACPPCLRTITAWDKVVGTSLDLVLELPSSLREPYVAQSLLWLGKAEKVLFLLVSELLMVSGSSHHHWATLVHILFFFFFSATLQGFWDLSSWPRTEAGPRQWKSRVLTPGPQGIPSPALPGGDTHLRVSVLPKDSYTEQTLWIVHIKSQLNRFLLIGLMNKN